MRRGRPPYPDVLTPREQEVLTLIREGLTNDQIATRLGISESGARYHVSEILSKLGVGSRYEAAQWAGEVEAPRRFRLSLPHLSPMMLAGGAAATAAVAFVGLAVGVLIMDARAEEPAEQVVAPTLVPFPVSPTPGVSDAALQLRSQILFDVMQTYRSARAGLASPARCECDPVAFVLDQRHAGSKTCQSANPATRQAPQFVPAIHEDMLAAVLVACDIFDATSPSTFLADVPQIVSLLEPFLIAEDAANRVQNQQPQLAPTPQHRPNVTPAGVYGVDRRTGNPAIDHALDLIYGSEWDQLANEANFREVECTFIYTPGMLECRAGEPEGTRHGTFGVGSCSPGHLQDRNMLASLLASYMTSAFLYAAFEVNIGQTHDPSYVFLLRDGLNSRDRQVYVDHEGRLMASYACGQADWLPGPNARTILPRLS